MGGRNLLNVNDETKQVGYGLPQYAKRKSVHFQFCIRVSKQHRDPDSWMLSLDMYILSNKDDDDDWCEFLNAFHYPHHEEEEEEVRTEKLCWNQYSI